MKGPFLRTPYNYDMNAAGDETALECKDPSLADQSQAEDADINTIVRRFGLDGQLPESPRVPSYQDFDGVFDFQSAMNSVRTATEDFMAMPARLRARFHNNPQELLEFVSNEDNRSEAVKLGLVPEKAAEIVASGPATVAPTASPAVPATPASSGASPAS